MTRKTPNRLALWIIAVALCVAGCWREVPPRMVKITASYPGASPTEVEEEIVEPLKAALMFRHPDIPPS
jgi:multidrug efflux pump subunit AcrB